MSYPPIFALANADAGVRALLKSGTGPLRFWLFGRAPQPGAPGYALPYSVWQTAYGSPENFLAGRPDTDNFGVQVDAYASTPEAARAVLEALSYSLELDAHVVSWRGEERETETNLFRSSMDVEFFTPRA